MTYTVKPGDTLSKIAQKLGVTLAALLDANPKFKANPNKINVGDVLNVPKNKPASPPPPPKPPTPPKPLSPPAPPPTPPVPPTPETSGAILGSLSAKYEVGSRGPGTVSTGIGDAGGASYGSYQMTSKPAGGTVKRFVMEANFPFANAFSGLLPGTAQFTSAWKQLAVSSTTAFQKSQHDFIENTHYDPFVAKIKSQDGLDVTKRSFALQNVIWSTAVQHGPGNSIAHLAIQSLRGLSQSDPSYDKKLIVAIYAERGRKDANGVLVHFARNSAKVQAGVAARFVSEEKDALKMLADES
ncbi:MAG TPA: LysM peptidoglycan-binding domain-containing protein [Pyrinomonadaceae bacterium]|jgi:murein DD-endopeptidase MepM/ murein hydrolase activator NlpD